MVATIKLPSNFISEADLGYFKEQGGFRILGKIEKTFGASSLNYLLTHTRVLYDRRSMDNTAGGTCNQSRTMSVVRLRYRTTNSKARSLWWSHVLLHELLHSLFADISLAMSASSDEPVAEGISILAENIMMKGPIPNKMDMIYTMRTLEVLEIVAKSKNTTPKKLLISLAGTQGTKISRAELLSKEYHSLKHLYGSMPTKSKESVEIMYSQALKRWLEAV
jgi:hypothetical protein